eukprot:Protomagalhaensia_sp_Gyna_25__3401@NODE_3070_length_745_cov_69_647309_g2566_i0_p1_GENE_NODE_3070_length_745_cov_69_647309_g2566_i0NODE_3070_length_745_cov_69_647309_g2566_i0_p1_ORF_typecomplete_len122_score21_64_NODE_3070_length_745_cov_69_647309_g2566_i0208573
MGVYEALIYVCSDMRDVKDKEGLMGIKELNRLLEKNTENILRTKELYSNEALDEEEVTLAVYRVLQGLPEEGEGDRLAIDQLIECISKDSPILVRTHSLYPDGRHLMTLHCMTMSHRWGCK